MVNILSPSLPLPPSLSLYVVLVPFNLLLIFATQKLYPAQCFAFSKALMAITSHSLKIPYLLFQLHF